MDNVVPEGGSYPKEFLDKTHREIVDKCVEVEIKRERDADKFPLPVFIHLDMEDGRKNLARLFMERG